MPVEVQQKEADEKKEQQMSAVNDSLEVPKDFKAYDKAWQKEYRSLAYQEALYTAVGGAAFFGMFGTFSKMLLDKAAGKEIDHDPIWTPVTIASMMLFGSFIAYMATQKQAARQKLEDNRLAHRINAGNQERMADQAKHDEEKPETYWQDKVKISKLVSAYALAA